MAVFAGAQISKALSHHAQDIEAIRVIRDRTTKQSRGFGFLKFSSIEKSTAFLEQNYPTFNLSYQMSANGDLQTAKVRVAYSRERDDRGKGDKAEADWTCRICSFVNFSGRKLCHKCHSPLELSSGSGTTIKPPEFTNNGDSDVSTDNSPSQFLLLRSLEPTVTEELLAKGVAKLFKPTDSASETPAKGAKKNGKIASTTGDANLGAKDGSLRRVMIVRDRQSNESWRYGFAEFAMVADAQAALTRFNSFDRFTIASKPVNVAFIHAGVFVPVFDPTVSSEGGTFTSSLNPAVRLQYWDEGAYVSELVINAAEEPRNILPAGGRVVDAAAAAAENEGLVGVDDEADPRNKKRKAELKAAEKQKKATPAHLQFWSNRHAELHGIRPKQDTGPDASTGEGSTEGQQPATAKPVQSYANLSKMCCYLCSRQFKTEAELTKHERLSELHRSNLEKDDLKTKAIAKLVKAGIDPSNLGDMDGQEYRDRAKERRHAFGPSKRVQLPLKKDQKSEPAAKDESVPASQSKGAALLGKMGWTQGQGLGAQGTGLTAAIETDVYAAGVGLGAEGAKIGNAAEEASRNTKDDYASFVQRAKDKAKERFDQMSSTNP